MLTDAQIRKAPAKERDYKLADERGLYLFVTRTGAKSFRMKYRFARREKRLTFGLYPEVTLNEARERRDEARRLLRDNRDPGLELQKAKRDSHASAERTFEKVAREWFGNGSSRWSEHHAADVLRSLVRDVFPEIGALPIAHIDTATVLATLRKIEKRGAIETARRVRQRMSDIFVYGISEGITKDDPAAIVTRAMKPLPKKGRQPAVTTLEEARDVLIQAEQAKASPVTKLASRLLALTTVRPGVILNLEWAGEEFEDLDGEAPLWVVPSARMKLRKDRKEEERFDHMVPLSRQAVEIIATLRRLTGRCRFAFPNHRYSHQPMSENAIGYLYNRVGYHGRHVPHGWRAAFSTIMNEKAEREGRLTDAKVIDLMLAHMPKDKVEGSYNRAAFLARRREIAQEWADVLLADMCPASELLVGLRK